MDEKINQKINASYPDNKFTQDISLKQFTDELLKLDASQRQELIQYMKELVKKNCPDDHLSQT